MAQGKLSVKKSKKGKIIVEILFEGKKGPAKVAVQDSNLTDTAMDGKDVEFEMDKGQAQKVVYGGDVIYEKGDPARSTLKPAAPKQHRHAQAKRTSAATSTVSVKNSKGELEKDHVLEIGHKAKAPYNFIPLNEKTVQAEPIPDFDEYHKDRFTGWIDLSIETRTPLYIRDSLTELEMKRRDVAEKKNERYINPDFFSPGGKLKIPGSSLRGMIRTLVEITSYGRFGAMNDKRLYYRGLADKSNLRSEYQNNMSSYDKKRKKSIHKMSAGYLYKSGFSYFIRPASGFKQIHQNEARKKVEKTGKSYQPFSFYPVEDGWVVVSGHMQKKNNEWLIFPPASDESFRIPETDVENYNNDASRGENVPNLIKEAVKMKEVPCFYVRRTDSNGEERVSFGHTGMFRLAYEMSIGDHIPEHLKRISGKYDIPEAIFGNAESFAGRVFFEDASLKDGQHNVLMDKDIPRLLQTPKPTTFQHYLVQPDDNLKNLRHYNDNSAIRGNKLYWHRSGNNWIEKDENKRKNDNLTTEITPVKPGTEFAGRIRFENLSRVELGALLFVLDLPEGRLHKLGMGKPIGLGSVHIKPALHLSDRKKRYENLFFEWENDPESVKDLSGFIQAFETYVKSQNGETSDNLWNTNRLKELKTMLNFETGVALEKADKIRYMEIEGKGNNEFKNRPVLPLPSRV